MNISRQAMTEANRILQEARTNLCAVLNCEVDLQVKIETAVSKLNGGYVISINDIVDIVSEQLNVSKFNIISKCRLREYTEARHISMMLCTSLTSLPLKVIGKYFNRDHSTVIHARETIENLLSYENDVKMKYEKCFQACDVRIRLENIKPAYKPLELSNTEIVDFAEIEAVPV